MKRCKESSPPPSTSSNGHRSMGRVDEDDEQLAERRHLLTIANVFRRYGRLSVGELARRGEEYDQLTASFVHLRDDEYAKHLQRTKQCVLDNQSLLTKILSHVETMFDNGGDTSVEGEKEIIDGRVTAFNMDKLQSTLRQVQRDWSSSGAHEREQCYKPVIDALNAQFGHLSVEQRADINVLVPGAGLARLAWQLASEGYSCQANETSFFMLFVSNFILNHCSTVDQHTIYPWVHHHANNISYEDQTRAVLFPDVDTTRLPTGGRPRFSMCAGEFVGAYDDEENRGRWNAVLSVFFLDTAINVCQYVNLIFRLLKPGGIWVNFGPLLYHYEGMDETPSIALPLEAVKAIIKKQGFIIETDAMHDGCSYTGNERSMLKYSYNCSMLKCRRPEE